MASIQRCGMCSGIGRLHSCRILEKRASAQTRASYDELRAWEGIAMPKVMVGLVGCGFVAELHMYAYKRVYGIDAEVTAVAARGDHVLDFAKKHDICEKTFAGYFGRAGDKTPIGHKVTKSLMYERVMEEMDETCAAIKSSGQLFMYAEDWIYAPAVTKSDEILNSTKDKVLFMKAEESHSGSHAAHAAQWAMTGGGSLIRMGCHPLSTVLYLKQVEARARGERIAVSSVTADTGNVATGLPPQDHVYIKSNPIDVEDWGMLTLTFSDGTKGTIFSGDIIMGGVRNIIELYTSGGSLFANITPNNHLLSYLTNEEKLANVYITEKVDRKTGWQFICLEEEWTRGYLQEIQDFMECVVHGRQPRAGLDLARETIKIQYAGYWSAEEGRRIAL